MTAEEPQVSLTGRYSPTEAARILRTSRSVIYQYANKGVLKFGYRRANNRRFVTGAEIMKIWKAQY